MGEGEGERIITNSRNRADAGEVFWMRRRRSFKTSCYFFGSSGFGRPDAAF
jgi:hypothetical protein